MRFIQVACFISAFCVFFSLKAQDFSLVKNLNEATTYCETNENAGIAFIHSELDSKDLVVRFGEKRKGDTLIVGEYIYKVLEKDRLQHFRFEYIYIDTKRIGEERAIGTRDEVLTRLKNGESFSELHRTYNMDRNGSEGDIGWVTLKGLPPCLQDKLQDLKPGEIDHCEYEGAILILRGKQKPRYLKGVYAVYDLFNGPSKHEAQLLQLKGMDAYRNYVKENPDVSLQLFDLYNDSAFLIKIENEGNSPFGSIYDHGDQRVLILKDTVVHLLDFDYIFVDQEADPGRVEELMSMSEEGVDFEILISKYGNPDKAFHSMHKVDQGILDPGLVAGIKDLGSNEITPVQIENRVFICRVNQPVLEVKAYLGVVYH